ncbi:hypothetical protein PAXRUDRAFT_22834 [Paxillus rubicundulus Ve08.2h10]|uniref:Unplaced genomic scaffold scaffold_6841, whole genome shotgun sequence n=1 Tax=Paxillus rubicundulus Ve08.2h10 TaxID=930991 RepID=A0A0D0BJF5_9AGAM|nr:hypothetical protein PAXRUDRAFT_22834 [Paxillus rubicundulus Ve08.2h10]
MAEALGLNENGTDEVREKALKERFPVEKDEELVYELTILLDQTGVIMAWHLPGVLYEEFQRDCEKPGIPLPRYKGAIELSPAWYQQGHQPKVSTILKGSHADPGPRQWFQAGALQNDILSATLMVMHPDLYASGRETFLKLASSTQDEDMQQIILEWASLFGGVGDSESGDPFP